LGGKQKMSLTEALELWVWLLPDSNEYERTFSDSPRLYTNILMPCLQRTDSAESRLGIEGEEAVNDGEAQPRL
jgi:hypothetical protein